MLAQYQSAKLTAKLVCGYPGANAVELVVVELRSEPGMSFKKQSMEEILVKIGRKLWCAIVSNVKLTAKLECGQWTPWANIVEPM